MAGEAAAALEAGEPVGSGSGNGGAAVDAKVRRYDRSTDPEAHSNPDLFIGEQGPADGRWIYSQPFAPPLPPHPPPTQNADAKRPDHSLRREGL